VQECLNKGTENQKNEIINAIVNKKYEESLFELMKNMYGNYVIQTALDVANDKNKDKLINCANQ